MDNKLLIIGLLAFSLVLFGCAKGGSTTAPSSGASVGAGAPSSAPSGQVEPSGETEGAGTTEPEAGGEGQQAPPETQTGGEVEPAPENNSEEDIGGLFNIDTVQPESGSGYDVPAAGEE